MVQVDLGVLACGFVHMGSAIALSLEQELVHNVVHTFMHQA